jgi:hypothetical protein
MVMCFLSILAPLLDREMWASFSEDLCILGSSRLKDHFGSKDPMDG